MKHVIRDVVGIWLHVHEPQKDKKDPNKQRFKAAFQIVPGSAQHQALDRCLQAVSVGKWQGQGQATLAWLKAEKRVCFSERAPISTKTMKPYEGMENIYLVNATSSVRLPENPEQIIDPLTRQPVPMHVLWSQALEEARPILLDMDVGCLNSKAVVWKRGVIAAGQAPVGSDALRQGGSAIIYAGARYNVVLDVYAQDSKDPQWGKRINSRLISMQKVRDGVSMEGVATDASDYEDYSNQLAAMNAAEDPLAGMLSQLNFGAAPPAPSVLGAAINYLGASLQPGVAVFDAANPLAGLKF